MSTAAGRARIERDDWTKRSIKCGDADVGVFTIRRSWRHIIIAATFAEQWLTFAARWSRRRGYSPPATKGGARLQTAQTKRRSSSMFKSDRAEAFGAAAQYARRSLESRTAQPNSRA